MLAFGSGPCACSPQASSVPGVSGADIAFPVRELRGGEYIFFTAVTCAGVRHDGPSPPLQSSTAGSKEQRSGSLIRPSLSPSSASQESRAPLCTSGYLAGGM